jgi:hypothetical protein
MARIASRVIEVNAGRVVLNPGGYDDYESTRLARAANDSQAGTVANSPARAGSPSSARAPRTPPARTPAGSRALGPEAPPAPRSSRSAKRGASRTQRTNEVGRLTREIETREQRIRVLEGQLADPAVYHDGARARDLVSEYERLRAELESLWQRMSELI